MKELLTYIVANLVSEPDAISIEEKVGATRSPSSCVLPRMIWAGSSAGHGRIAKEIRTLMKAAGNREDKKVSVDICD